MEYWALRLFGGYKWKWHRKNQKDPAQNGYGTDSYIPHLPDYQTRGERLKDQLQKQLEKDH